MALWLCRAGKMGEYETKIIEDKKLYCTWSNLNWDMAAVTDRDAFKEKVRETYPDESANTIRNWAGQLWAFSHGIKAGDWVMVPSKIKPVVHIAEVKTDYQFNASASEPYQHIHQVKWLKEIPRAAFEQDLLYSIGAFMTVCQITRNDAQQRVHAMVTGAASSSAAQQPPVASDDDAADGLDIDLEENAFQEIADKIIRKYAGHGLAKIVAAILEAKGFTTYVSPPGPDNGVDILASQGSLGFDPPRICVQVKSGDTPLDRATHDQLIGAMSNHKADYGMLVSWGGFKNTIRKEEANHFFKVRLWTHKEIVQEFLRHYADLPEEIREAIALKQIWIIDKRAD